MHNISAICFDVDGTLIDDQKKISPNTVRLVKKFITASDCRIILTSSRMPRSLRKVAEELEVDCDLAAYDGSLCVRKIGGGWDLCFDERIGGYDNSILDSIEFSEDLFCGLFYGENWVVSGTGRWLDRELRSTKIVPDFIDETVLRDFIISGRPISKIMFRGEPSKVNDAREKLSNLSERFTCYSNKETILEFLPKSGSKAKGAAKILGMFSSHLPDVIAFGDGYNDVPLMKAAEFSVAMGNAIEECRTAAKFETLDNNSDGIAVFLTQFLTERKADASF